MMGFFCKYRPIFFVGRFDFAIQKEAILLLPTFAVDKNFNNYDR